MDSLRTILTRLEKQGAALGHFNVADLVLVKSVLAAAAEIGVPVMIGASEGERAFFGTHELAAVVKSLRDQSGLPVFLNADHTHSLTKAVEAVKAGFDSVVADFSALPFAENVSRTKEAVEALKAINPSLLVEGEIGNIGSGSEIHDTVTKEFRNLTTPEEARQFVAATGIDVLASSRRQYAWHAEKHGARERKEATGYREIGEIKKAAGVFLTLHGGSGTDDTDFRNAIAAGINIIHINTELRVAWRASLEDSLKRQPNEVVLYKILPPVIDSVKQVVSSRLKLFSAQRMVNEMPATA